MPWLVKFSSLVSRSLIAISFHECGCCISEQPQDYYFCYDFHLRLNVQLLGAASRFVPINIFKLVVPVFSTNAFLF